MNFKRGYPHKTWSDRAILAGCSEIQRPMSERRKTVDPIDVHEAVAFERETRDQDWDDDRLRCSYCGGGPCEALYSDLWEDWGDPYCPPPIPLAVPLLEVVAFR